MTIHPDVQRIRKSGTHLGNGVGASKLHSREA